MNENIYKSIGKRIKKLRLAHGFKYKNGFCDRYGFNRPNFSRIESGKNKTRLETLQKIADALGVPIYMLFSDDKLYSEDEIFKPDYTLEIKREDCKEKEKINIKIKIEE